MLMSDSCDENFYHKRRLLAELVADPRRPGLNIGCNPAAPTGRAVANGDPRADVNASAVEAARRRRPAWDYMAADALDSPLAPVDSVVCLDVLIHQPTLARYRELALRLCELTGDTLIVSGYDWAPAITRSTFFHEPITRTLSQHAGFTEMSVVSKHQDDICLVVARKRAPTSHPRDLRADDFNLMSAITDYPLLLRTIVDTARARIGFFPAQLPRALEYPWVLASLPHDLAGRAVLDVGAGVNPLPFQLSERGARVYTVDGHPVVRNPAERDGWNEWGFLDYSMIDERITSIHAAYQNWTPGTTFDFIYSVSVIEHLPAETRRAWIRRFAAQLKADASLLLTVDLFAESDGLRNFSEGKVVEPEEQHGSLHTVVEELTASGLSIRECSVKRNIPRSRVDTAFIRASRRA
jgi:2-polyprenyl-3-methyl-5-hydroxy-6-metoxy-1,4-benzoquinol methylase